MNLLEITKCYIEKELYQNDRDCIVKDPTADILEVVTIIDRRLKRAWNTEFLQLKIRSEVDEENQPYIIEYMWQNHQIYNKTCPPKEIEQLIEWSIDHNIDAFYAFLWFCERQANKYAAAAALYATEAARYATTVAARAAAADAAAAARYATDAAAAAEIEQILFLRLCLGGEFVE